MTQRGTHTQARTQEAHDLQQRLHGLSEEAQYFLRPTMNGLLRAANEEFGDGASLGAALPPAINNVTDENAEEVAEELAHEDAQAALLSFADSIKSVFTTMTAPTQDGKLLTGEMVRYRIRQASTQLHAATRIDAILEGRNALRVMMPDYPDIQKALDGIEKAGEEAADKLDFSDLAMQLRQAGQQSVAKG